MKQAKVFLNMLTIRHSLNYARQSIAEKRYGNQEK